MSASLTVDKSFACWKFHQSDQNIVFRRPCFKAFWFYVKSRSCSLVFCKVFNGQNNLLCTCKRSLGFKHFDTGFLRTAYQTSHRSSSSISLICRIPHSASHCYYSAIKSTHGNYFRQFLQVRKPDQGNASRNVQDIWIRTKYSELTP